MKKKIGAFYLITIISKQIWVGFDINKWILPTVMIIKYINCRFQEPFSPVAELFDNVLAYNQNSLVTFLNTAV